MRLKNMISVIYITLITQVHFSIKKVVKVLLWRLVPHWNKTETARYRSPYTQCCCNDELPIKYYANTNSWMTIMVFEYYLIQLNRKIGAKNLKILLFINQYSVHLKNTTFLRKIKVVFSTATCTSHLQPVDLGITRANKCLNRQQFIQKTVIMIDGKLQSCSTYDWNPGCYALQS